jgi:2'-5' RNA ligase
MSKIRAFFAINTSEEVKSKILDVQTLLKQIESDVKWEPEEKFHITLKFLGDIDETLLKEMTETIRLEVKNFYSFKLTYEGLGCFPTIKFPRVIWIGCKCENDRIFNLNEIVENISSSFNFPLEKGKFHPHITLGRVKGNNGLKEITSLVKEIKFDQIDGTADEIYVMKSTLQRTGSIYSIVDKISLNK